MAFAKGITAEYVLFCTHKRVPERTAVPAGHESPSGAFKPQTGLQSKCRVFSAARSLLLSRRGRRRVAAPCVCFVPCAALASCRPLPQQLLPAFPLLSLCDIFPRPGEVFGRWPRSSPLQTKGCSPLIIPKQLGSIQKIQVAALEDFLCSADFEAPQPLRRQLPAGKRVCVFNACIICCLPPHRCCSVYTSHLPCARMKPTNQRR